MSWVGDEIPKVISDVVSVSFRSFLTCVRCVGKSLLVKVAGLPNQSSTVIDGSASCPRLTIRSPFFQSKLLAVITRLASSSKEEEKIRHQESRITAGTSLVCVFID
jgi:hypothetical protein